MWQTTAGLAYFPAVRRQVIPFVDDDNLGLPGDGLAIRQICEGPDK